MSFLPHRVRHLAQRVLYLDNPIGSLARSIRSALPTRSLDKAYWDASLSGACAAYLGATLSIDARNALVSTLLHHCAPAARAVLDVGCAGGTLASALPNIEEYFGIDISDVAIRDATARVRRTGCTFQVSDMTNFRPGRVFDVIVFNEVLYYLPLHRVVPELRRYSEFLSENGKFCVSMKQGPKSEGIYSQLVKSYRYKCGLLYQEKLEPEYLVRLSRQRPGYLVTLWDRM